MLVELLGAMNEWGASVKKITNKKGVRNSKYIDEDFYDKAFFEKNNDGWYILL